MAEEGAVFVAKYGSKCGAGDTIVPGDECRYVGTFAYHLSCVPEAMVEEPKDRNTKWDSTSVDDMGY